MAWQLYELPSWEQASFCGCGGCENVYPQTPGPAYLSLVPTCQDGPGPRPSPQLSSHLRLAVSLLGIRRKFRVSLVGEKAIYLVHHLPRPSYPLLVLHQIPVLLELSERQPILARTQLPDTPKHRKMKAEQDPELATAPPQHVEGDVDPKGLAATKELDVGVQVLGGEGDIEYTEEGQETNILPTVARMPSADEKHRGQACSSQDRLAHHSFGRLGLRTPVCRQGEKFLPHRRVWRRRCLVTFDSILSADLDE